MNPLTIILAALTFISTLVGGTLAIRYREQIKYFFAFAAGSLISVTFFDILPESISLAIASQLSIRYLMITLVLVFLIYSFLERYLLTHHHNAPQKHGHVMGPVGATGLILHSFFDGAAIGAGFQVSNHVGLIVALAVIFHDFTDGVNTVTLMLANKQHVKRARFYLIMDAIAPVLGVILTSFILISPVVLAIILAAFSGEFLYIGATSLLPETYKEKNWKMTLFLLLGISIMLILTSII